MIFHRMNSFKEKQSQQAWNFQLVAAVSCFSFSCIGVSLSWCQSVCFGLPLLCVILSGSLGLPGLICSQCLLLSIEQFLPQYVSNCMFIAAALGPEIFNLLGLMECLEWLEFLVGFCLLLNGPPCMYWLQLRAAMCGIAVGCNMALFKCPSLHSKFLAEVFMLIVISFKYNSILNMLSFPFSSHLDFNIWVRICLLC